VKFSSSEYSHQEVYFGCRTDGRYIEKVNAWHGLGSLLVSGNVDVPHKGYKLGPK
jgi:hypothetical protein